MFTTEKLLNEKIMRLAKIQDDLVAAENAVSHLEYDITATKKKRRQAKLLEAGKIIEDAGLLDQYDPDELYLLLVQHKNELLKK